MSGKRIDWDTLPSREEVWVLNCTGGRFSLVFLNGKLWLIHDNGTEAHAEELADGALTGLLDVLDSYEEWRWE